MNRLSSWLAARLLASESGAVGALVIGILLGIAVVIFAIVKFLIPGE